MAAHKKKLPDLREFKINPWVIPGLGGIRKGTNFNSPALLMDFNFLMKELGLELKHFRGKQKHEISRRKAFAIMILVDHYRNDQIAALTTINYTEIPKSRIRMTKQMRRSQKLREQFEELKLKFKRHKNGNNDNETEQS